MMWQKLDDAKIARAIDLYRGGKTCAAVAKELSVTKQNIHSLLKKRGVLIKRKTKMKLTPTPSIRKLISEYPPEDQWWMEEFMKRERARNAVFRAVKSGRLTRLPCEGCGERNSEGHHDDYDKPLEVRWLCNHHHNEWHRINGKSRFTGLPKPVSQP